MNHPVLQPKDRIIVAADVPDLATFERLAKAVAGHCTTIKIGLELITACGPDVVHAAHNLNLLVMYDGKFHDIPQTMGRAASRVAELGVDCFTIHACAGKDGIAAAVKQAKDSTVIGVTVLTSHSEQQARDIFGILPDAKVMNFVQDLTSQGAWTVVCSPKEVQLLRSMKQFADLRIIAPGIRPTWAEANDQKRVMTPTEAIRAGVDRIVIGRPVTECPQGPAEALKRLSEEIEAALAA